MSDALGKPVDLAIVVGRRLVPPAIEIALVLFASVAAGFWLYYRPNLGGWLLLIVAVSLWANSHATVFLVRSGQSILVVRSRFWMSWLPSSKILARYDVGVPSDLGPSSLWRAPLTLGDDRFWVTHRNQASAEEILGVSDGASPNLRGLS